MRQNPIHQALSLHLEKIEGIPPISYANKDLPLPIQRPYLRVEMIPVDRSSGDLAGGKGIKARGYMQVTIVGNINPDDGTGEVGVQDLADDIAEHFKKGTMLHIGSGLVTIDRVPDQKVGFRSNSDWRKQVHVNYWANNKGD